MPSLSRGAQPIALQQFQSETETLMNEPQSQRCGHDLSVAGSRYAFSPLLALAPTPLIAASGTFVSGV